MLHRLQSPKRHLLEQLMVAIHTKERHSLSDKGEVWVQRRFRRARQHHGHGRIASPLPPGSHEALEVLDRKDTQILRGMRDEARKQRPLRIQPEEPHRVEP